MFNLLISQPPVSLPAHSAQFEEFFFDFPGAARQVVDVTTPASSLQVSHSPAPTVSQRLN
jgi:hypothetical protein